MKDIHLIEDSGTYALFHTPTGSFFEISRDIHDRMSQYTDEGGSGGNDPKVAGILEYLRSMPVKRMRTPHMDRRLNKLTFLSAQDCNLECRYCFADHGSFRENRRLHMTGEVYRDALAYILDRYPDGIESIMFFGGEPLLGFNEIKGFIPYCMDEFTGRGIKPPRFGLVTNGTVINDEIIDFFNHFDNFMMTISIDGPKNINDKVRVSGGGWSVYDAVRESIGHLNRRRKFRIFAEITLNRQHVLEYEKGKARRWMEEIKGMGFEGAVVGVAESSNEFLEIPVDYKSRYKEMYREIADTLFDFMCGSDGFMNSDIVRAMQMLRSEEALQAPCSAGVNNLTVTASGDVIPCYTLYGQSKLKMGNVKESGDTSRFCKVSNAFLKHDKNKTDECRTCWMKDICIVWCRGFNYTCRNNMFSVSLPRCWTNEALFESVITNLVRIRSNSERFDSFRKSILCKPVRQVVAN